VHIIGKDIIWFHCVIWPCMLQSAGVELPHHVFAHGFIAGADGRKMSKSLGNVVDPHDLLMKYSVDTVRWYMCRETPYGNDISFSLASLVNMHNSELCDTLGNLAHRTFNLNQKFSGSIVPEPLAGATYAPFDLNALRDEVEACMEQFSLQSAFGAVIAAVRDTNKFINDEAPWLLKGDEHANTRAEVSQPPPERFCASTP
jgi:methionyl-tRNA synthetase